MNRLLSQLPALQAALSLPSTSGPAPAPDPAKLDALIRGIKRKAAFAAMHMCLLRGIDWERVDGIGRRPDGGVTPEHLSVRLSDAFLSIEHTGAVIDHVYLAFDGLVAALANMADTLGRLICSTYGLSVQPHAQSLGAVRSVCPSTSAVGAILHNPQKMEWLKKVRSIRGRCQHADVEDVIVAQAGPYSRRGQPSIEATYCWKNAAAATLIVVYAEDAYAAAEDTFAAIVTAILAAPSNPVS